jgi:hypothetical protein
MSDSTDRSEPKTSGYKIFAQTIGAGVLAAGMLLFSFLVLKHITLNIFEDPALENPTVKYTATLLGFQLPDASDGVPSQHCPADDSDIWRIIESRTFFVPSHSQIKPEMTPQAPITPVGEYWCYRWEYIVEEV